MASIEVHGGAIVGWNSFHDEFQRAFRFFEGYGRNGDAWIDCMTDLHGPNSLSGLALAEGEPIEILLTESAALATRHPEILAELEDLVACANRRYASMGDSVRISVTHA